MPSVRSGPSLGKCWAKIRLTSTFDLRLLALWGVMNITGVPTKVVCAECMKMCCLGGKNSVVKGLSDCVLSMRTKKKIASEMKP